MSKEEMKNKISMALKDPILQQGFEIICKENAELEKHNEELIALINAERERQEKCDDVHLRKIAELEKENAELKLKLEALDGQIPWKDIKDKSEVIEKLTKAKELLKRYVKIYVNPYPEEEVELRNEAEQFLNSEVEK